MLLAIAAGIMPVLHLVHEGCQEMGRALCSLCVLLLYRVRSTSSFVFLFNDYFTVVGKLCGTNDVEQQMDPAKQIKVMQDFQKHSAQMDMTTEMISDSIDGALDDDELEDETDDLTNQVLDEIGIDVAAQVRLSCLSGFDK
jgi:hypothetical protein